MGRTAIYEYIDQKKINKLFCDNLNSLDEFDSLFKAGLKLVDSGETTLQEIYSIVGNERG
ncbi:hypothetical protein MASR2M36_34080 [Providencia sp.]